VKGYPFEVETRGGEIAGCVLSDQVKSLDWTERNIEFVETLAEGKLTEVFERIRTLIL